MRYSPITAVRGIVALVGLSFAALAMAAPVIEARLDADRVQVGSTLRMVVSVRDPKGNVEDPEFALPAGLELLGSARSQQFSFVNGRATSEVQFQYSIGAVRAGTYTVGPVRVTVNRQTYRSSEQSLVVTDGAARAPGPSGGTSRPSGRAADVASLILTLEPPQPVVGQLCRLRAQLVQRVAMAEESQYDAPPTPGFWSETWGDVTRYEAREGRRTVVVNESSVRVYPLAAGVARIGAARAVVAPAGRGAFDPFAGIDTGRLEIVSDSLRIPVRPLPDGAPSGFDGGVGRFRATWSADRSHTAQDQAVTVRLAVRGEGNLPLLRTPSFAVPEFEVFAATVEDSLPRAGQIGEGRRTFVWTLLPKRTGTLRIPAPVFAWYDPDAGRYASAPSASLTLQVLAAAAGADDEVGAMPSALRRLPASPGDRAAWPWLAFLGGALLVAASFAWRRAGAVDPAAVERARQREWLRAVGLAHGPDFWRAADESATWLQSRGDAVQWLRDAIHAARYGGRVEAEEDVRRKLVERLALAMPAPRSRAPWRAAAAILVLAGFALAVWAMPQQGPRSLAERSRAADARAREGHVAEAEAAWARLWDERPGDPALAARLAWAALERDDRAVASLWVLRGDRQEARDPALGLSTQRVREAGGLVGAPGRALPLRSSEWAWLAFILMGLAAALSRWRPAMLAVMLLAVVCGAWWSVESAWRSTRTYAVVRQVTNLPQGDLQLEPGQVVRVLGREGDEVQVVVSRDLDGVLPVTALWFPWSAR